MKEIKFRLWCKDLEEMTEIEKMGFENNQLWYIGCIDHDKEETYFPENDDHVLMQYTGLKDKNGKEIYEGDIINYSFTDCGEVNTRVLEVYNDGTNFKTQEIYRDYWLEKVGGVLSIVHGQLNAHKGKTQYLADISCSSIYSYEVIGNIYENPELLGGAGE